MVLRNLNWWNLYLYVNIYVWYNVIFLWYNVKFNYSLLQFKLLS